MTKTKAALIKELERMTAALKATPELNAQELVTLERDLAEVAFIGRQAREER
jgi:hypothetical protein